PSQAPPLPHRPPRPGRRMATGRLRRSGPRAGPPCGRALRSMSCVVLPPAPVSSVDRRFEWLDEPRESVRELCEHDAVGSGKPTERLELDPRTSAIHDRPPATSDDAVYEEGRERIAVAGDDPRPILVADDPCPIVMREDRAVPHRQEPGRGRDILIGKRGAREIREYATGLIAVCA